MAEEKQDIYTVKNPENPDQVYEVPKWVANKLKSDGSYNLTNIVKGTVKEAIGDSADIDWDKVSPTEALKTFSQMSRNMQDQYMDIQNKLEAQKIELEKTKLNGDRNKVNVDDIKEQTKAELEKHYQEKMQAEIKKFQSEYEKNMQTQNAINNFKNEVRSYAIQDRLKERFADQKTFDHFFDQNFQLETIDGKLYVKDSNGELLTESDSRSIANAFSQNNPELFGQVQKGTGAAARGVSNTQDLRSASQSDLYSNALKELGRRASMS
jgi:hypothetical protein